MKIELIVVRDPDGDTSTTLFVDGERVTDGVIEYEIDAGRGYTWEDWKESRDYDLALASSPAVRAELLSWYSDPPGWKYIDWVPVAPDGELDFLAGIDGPRYWVVSATHGLVWSGDDEAEANEVAFVAAVNSARTVYLHDRETEGVTGTTEVP